MQELTAVRIDRWLWAARFFKTRSIAKAAVEGGKVHIVAAHPTERQEDPGTERKTQRIKASKEVHVGECLIIARGSTEQTIVIEALAEQRGPAKVAQTLYRETSGSLERRLAQAARRSMERAGLKVPVTKPTKKGRRDLRRLKTLDDSA